MKERARSGWTHTASNPSTTDLVYEERRESLLDTVDLKQYVDHPFLFIRRQRLTDYLTRIKLFEKILCVKGSIVECGVNRGGGLMLYYHLSSILEPFAFNRKIYGFDTFESFKSVSESDVDVDESMFEDADYEILKSSIELQDMNRPVSHIPKCELIRGDALRTIPEFTAQHPELIIALLYLDFDIYEPTKVALEHFLPLVPKGGIVAFDELNMRKWAGETKAMKEVINLNDVRLVKFCFEPASSYFVVGS